MSESSFARRCLSIALWPLWEPKRFSKSPWDARARSRITYLRSQNEIEECKCKCPLRSKEKCKRNALTCGIRRHLYDAERAVGELESEIGLSFTQGASLERVWSHLRAADVAMLELVSRRDLASRSSEVLAMAKVHLEPDDPQRVALERRIKLIRLGKVSRIDRGILIHALDAAYAALDAELSRVRSLRTMLLTASLVILLGVAGLAIYGWLSPETFSFCFIPKNAADLHGSTVVCPSHDYPNSATKNPSRFSSPEDIFTIELAGLCGAALTVIASMRRMPGTSKPYGLPLASAVLKFPTGALTALLGVLFVYGGFVPGLSLLDGRAQVLAWAVVFGAAQHLVTRLVDARARETLSAVSL